MGAWSVWGLKGALHRRHGPCRAWIANGRGGFAPALKRPREAPWAQPDRRWGRESRLEPGMSLPMVACLMRMP